MSALPTHPPAPPAPSGAGSGPSKRPGLAPQIIGILNVTPDSFSDGGRHAGTEDAVSHGLALEREGASVLDVGGQSTRPGHEEISAEEEIARVVPVLRALHGRTALPLSIDTYKPAVARAALAAGANWLNDIHGFQRSPELADLAAAHGCTVILMHQEAGFDTVTGGTMERIADFLQKSVDLALAAGLPRERLILDPGIGFAKTHAQNLEILSRLGELRALGCPLLLGASRKSVIGQVLGLPASDRLEGTLATTALAVWQGVEYLRVHDVQANLRAARVAAALRDHLPPHA